MVLSVKRLAADVLNVGVNKIRLDPTRLSEISGSLTRADIRELIKKGVIVRLKNAGRDSTAKKRKRTPAHMRGTVIKQKDAWMERIRAQRKFLKFITSTKAINNETRKSLYGKIKSGIFKNKRAIVLYLKDAALIAKDFEIPKGKLMVKETNTKSHLTKEHAPKPSKEKEHQKTTTHKEGEEKNKSHKGEKK